MTIAEFYDVSGGGYEEMKSKFSADSTILTFLKIFNRDTNFEKLTKALEDGDVDGAFAAAHTLKGMALNLYLNGLKNPVCAVTEALRSKDLEGAKELFPALEGIYSRIKGALAELLA